MCPYCAVRGRLGNDGTRPFVANAGRTSAAAKTSADDERRVCVVIHQSPPRWSGAPETFGVLNRRRCLRSLCKTFDASHAILSAQYDGLDSEDQLTCGALVFRVVAKGRQPLAVASAYGAGEYTPKAFVETMSYGEVDVTEQQAGEERAEVRHLEVTEDQAGQRLDNFVHKLLGDLPRSRIYRVIRKGEVRVNGHRAGPDTRLQAHDKIRIPPVKVRPASEIGVPSSNLLDVISKAIVYQDDNILVLDKPAGLAVHGGSGINFGAIEGLRALRPGESLELVHRLDRDTSGVLLVARNTTTLRTLHALLREKGDFEKRYLALIKGKWDLGRKRIDIPLRTDLRVGGERTVRADASGKPSVSEFRPIQFFGKRATLMEVTIFTGRTHQIRVHALHAGHPVAGDPKYGDEEFNTQMKDFGLNRMFLHAHSVSFDWPAGGQFSVNTPLPPELAATIDALAATKTRSRRS
jgi:23S rRNA pseudouridine955/2504/2580 synthase